MRQLLNITVVVLTTFSSFGQGESFRQIKQSVTDFISTLTDEQKRLALHSLNDTTRIKWNNLPLGLAKRPGINIGQLTNEQRKALHRILSSSLSSQGYLKSTGIMNLDNLLAIYFDSLHIQKKIGEKEYAQIKTLKFNHENFFISIYGDVDNEPWSFKIEGHHLSINMTFIKNSFSITPLFMGADPAEYEISAYAGWRILGQEEDLGIHLIKILNDKQKKTATLNQEVPQDIITSAESNKRLVDYWGIKANEFNEIQKTQLKYIIYEYVHNLEHDKADLEFDKILSAGLENIYFGWIGSYEETKPHYFILNGPTFIIEFDNRGNHIHTIWREKGNDFGQDILKDHYLKSSHHKN